MSPDTERDERTITETVIHSVADHQGVDPIDLEPLYNAVDPDALEALFGGDRNGALGRVEFELSGCLVAVTGDGDVEVSSLDDERRVGR